MGDRPKYYVLLEREGRGQPWSVQFGDFERSVVMAERQDRHESWPFPKLVNLIVATCADDSQEAIDNVLEDLNGALKANAC